MTPAEAREAAAMITKRVNSPPPWIMWAALEQLGEIASALGLWIEWQAPITPGSHHFVRFYRHGRESDQLPEVCIHHADLATVCRMAADWLSESKMPEEEATAETIALAKIKEARP